MSDGDTTGYRFSWGLAFAGAAVSVAVTFMLLLLGSGVGLMFVRPESTAAHFLTGGAIYFVVVVAFGFALGGHVAGRLLGPLPEETQFQEEMRAALHGLVVWAVSVLATLGLVAAAGAATAALYGVSRVTETEPMRTTELAVDRLFRPGTPPAPAEPSATPSPVTVTPAIPSNPAQARAEAGRLIEAYFRPSTKIDAPDRARLIELTAGQARVSSSEARLRVAAVESRSTAELQRSAEIARRTASTTALWLAFALLFGAVVAMVAAVTARLEDDHQTAWTLFSFHRGWRS